MLMRLSLRLLAERGSRSSRLGAYLDDPVQLFLPVRAMLGVVHVAVAVLLVSVFGLDNAAALLWIGLSARGLHRWSSSTCCRTSSSGAIPSACSTCCCRRSTRLRAWCRRSRRRCAPCWPRGANSPPRPRLPVSDEDQLEATTAYLDAGEQEGLIERDERQLLQSIVDFGDTLVREVMTPRPDIVAIRSDATLGELRALFREQEYSRIPVYIEILDNIAGFVFVKDLMRLPATEPPRPAGLDAGAPGLRRARDQAGARAAQASSSASRADRDRRRRIRRHGRPGDDRGPARGDRRRDPRRVRRRNRAVRRRGPGARSWCPARSTSRPSASASAWRSKREGFETVGGYVMSHLGRVPAAGEVDSHRRPLVEVLDAERRRVHRVRVWKRRATPMRRRRPPGRLAAWMKGGRQ